MKPVRVAIVDDHGMVRDGLKAAIGDDPGLAIVGDAGTLAEAIALCLAETPDVVICDQQLPDGLGSDLPAALDTDTVRVLLVSGLATEQTVAAAVAGGCAGFVAKADGIAKLVDAVGDLMADRAVFPAGLLRRMAAAGDAAGGVSLTSRELDVLRLLAQAKGSEEIADELVVSLHTVRNHIRNALAKLGATTRLEAVVNAARLGIVDVSASEAE